MSAELKLPLDFERLPEVRLLGQHLTRQLPAADYRDALVPHLFTRLFVELGYQAQATSQPGHLSTEAFQLFLTTVPGVGTVEITAALVESRLLERREGGYFCPLFARWNSHLSGDYVSRESRAAASSAVVRQRQQVAHDANATLMLLPGEMLRDREGRTVEPVVLQRALTFILSVDRALKRTARPQSSYGSGLIADAIEVVEKYSAEQLAKFYAWVIANREKPGLPKTTEQLIPNLASYIELAWKA